MSVLDPYRRILATPGALLFSLTGVVARLPISMVGLGIVLLIESSRGSYAVAGAVSAVYTVANAVLAVFQGRLLDRLGQATVLSVASGVFGVAMVLLVTSVEADLPIAMTCAAAAAAGASLPQIGSCVRARWAHVLDRPAEVQTAFALEAVLDEVVFICGPILVTVLATAVDPVLGVAVALVAGVGGGLAFAAQRGTEPPAHVHDHASGPRPALPWRTLVPVAVVSTGLGMLFGAAEITTVAFAEEHDAKAWAGGLLAAWALGSMLSGIVTGAMGWRIGPEVRVRRGALAMACAMAPLYFVDSVPLMAVVLVVGGVAIAPTLVAALAVVERVVPPSRLTEGMAFVQTGIVAGVAPGAALSGVVVDHYGASAAYLVSLAAGLLAAAAGQLIPRDQPGARPPAGPETLVV